MNPSEHTYISNALHFRKFRRSLRATLRHHEPYERYDSLVVTGMSGALVAGVASMWTGLPITVVRKREVRSHSSRIVDGIQYVYDGEEYTSPRYLFLDDHVASGSTLERVSKELWTCLKPVSGIIAGVALWNPSSAQSFAGQQKTIRRIAYLHPDRYTADLTISTEDWKEVLHVRRPAEDLHREQRPHPALRSKPYTAADMGKALQDFIDSCSNKPKGPDLSDLRP